VSTHFVIIGNGAAGFRAAKSIRRADGDAHVSIITEEAYPFYLRRQLGEFLAGHLTLPEVLFQSRNAYRRERIDLFLETPIVRIDPAAHDVVFASGQRVRYDRLLVATGTRSEPPAIPGAERRGVARFDTLAAAVQMKETLGRVRRAVILGEGLIGLTLAESLAVRGIRVTQLVPEGRFWPAMLDETASTLVEGVLEAGGVELVRGAAATAIVGAVDQVAGVQIADGRTLPADLVACGGRRRPAVELLEGCGIEVGRGIRVDAALRTNQPDVFAAGDVAELAGAEDSDGDTTAFCWQRAWAQGGLAAAGMLGRKAEPLAEAMRIRTVIFGVDLAVIGRGNLPAGGDVEVFEFRREPNLYRRLVFQSGLLAGAIVLGTAELVHELNRLTAQRAPREKVEHAMGLAGEPTAEVAFTQTFAAHCPICAAELVVHAGTRTGSTMRCPSCNVNLAIGWDGRRGWLDVGRL